MASALLVQRSRQGQRKIKWNAALRVIDEKEIRDALEKLKTIN